MFFQPTSFVRFVHVLLAALAGCVLLLPAKLSADTQWEVAPYRVRAWIAVDDAAQLPRGRAEQIGRRTAQLAEAYMGAAWRVEIRAPPTSMRGELLVRHDTLRAGQILDREPRAADCDKLMLVVVRREASRWHVAVRELDIATRQLSPLAVDAAVDVRGLPRAIVRGIVAAFSPLVLLRRPEADVVEGRLRAGGLILSDESPLLVEKDTPLVPVLRVNDRLGRAEKDQVELVPWTVLQMESRDGAKLSCRIHSARARPLGTRSTLRLQRYALAVRTLKRPTRLVLTTPSEPSSPLVDYELVQREEASGGMVSLGRTDESGVVEIPPPDRPWRLLYIRHGGQLLARLPLVTGWRRELQVPLRSDDMRLEAEGFITAIKQEIVDAVARRQILAGQVRRRIADGQFDEAEELLLQFHKLDGRRDFQVRLQSAKAQMIADNARAQQHIDAMFTEAEQVLTRYLDPQQLDRLTAQLAQAQREIAPGTVPEVPRPPSGE